MSERIVGIDLGTSNTVVAYVDELDKLRLAPDPEGHTVHPSVVSFHPGGGVVVGVAGKQRKVIDPKNTIYSAKRMIGQPFGSFAVQETARRVPFELKQGPNEQAIVSTRAGDFAIPEISAIVLDHARKLASAALREDVARAVVTVPASFTDVQRSSTATAGALAGLTVVRVLNEPTAAAIAYGSTKRLDEIIAVYDWGGGTFDITILKLEDQVYTVLGTSGDAFLGGEDMDERLVDKMVAGFLKEHRIDLRQNEAAMIRLRAVAEHTKIELSKRSRAVVKIEEIAHGKGGKTIDLEATLTRDELIGGIGDLIERTFASCKEAMVLAGIGADKIRDVVLVGGTTRIPFVRDRVANFFNREPRSDMNPEDAIATGAALQASSIERMLARTPQRPIASVPIPLDDLEEATSADDVDAPSKIAELKRPKRGTDMFSGQPRGGKVRIPDDPAKTAERAKAFFGDLFGDKAAPAAAPAKPEPKLTATRPIARIKAPPKPAMPAMPPIVETRRELPPKNRTMALPVVTRPPAQPDPVPEPSMPTIDLAELDDDNDFKESEKSGELLIELDPGTVPPARAKPGDSLIPVEIDPATVPPRSPRESIIPIEIDPATVPPRAKPRDSTSQFAIEIDPPSMPPGPPIAVEIDPPSVPPRRPSIPPGLDRPRTASPRRRATQLDEDDLVPPPGRPPSYDPNQVDPPSLRSQLAATPSYDPGQVDPPSLRSQLLQELDPASSPPIRGRPPSVRTQILQELDPPSRPPGSPIELDMDMERSGSASLAIELIDPDAGAPIDLVMPPPKPMAAMSVDLDFDEPAMAPMPAAPAPRPPTAAPVSTRPLPTVVDVTPRSLGIGTVAGFCEELIRRNSQLPITARKLFGTARDLQDSVRIVVCQGESRRIENNVLVGELVLENIPRRARGETKIDVEFRLDASGILHIAARDVATGAEQRARLDLRGGMAPEAMSAAADRIAQLSKRS